MGNEILYNPDFVEYKPIFSKEELEKLEKLSNSIEFENWFLINRNMEDFSINFSYSSAKLEGNSYTFVEAETLLKSKTTTGNKNIDDANMLINMKKAFSYLITVALDKKRLPIKDERELKRFVKDLHTLSASHLLLEEQQGNVRKMPVKIGGSKYVPLSNPHQLEEEMDYILKQYIQIENPFEKALYIHNNLAYLQYFIDHNKRTSRNMLAFSLLTQDKMPILFNERDPNEYANAVVSYYETGNYELSKKYFIDCYEELVKRYGKELFQKQENKIKRRIKP